MDIEKELQRELSFSDFIENTLAQNAGKIQAFGIKIFAIQKASPKDDMENGFDFVFTMGNFTVPVRIRKPSCRYRDFTIRSKTRYGNPTEIDKLKKGAGDVYFYAWTRYNNLQEQVSEWWLINLNQFRNSGLINVEKTDRSNGDGTCFISFSYQELIDNGCIIAKGIVEQDNLIYNF